MDLGLAGKVVFLTGGSGGLGGPLAHGFASEGARVALSYLTNDSAAKDTATQIERTGGQALTVRYDLADADSIQGAVQAVVSAWGGIDVLVLSASPAGGPNRRPVLFEEVPAAQWQRQIRSEVEGAFGTVQAVLPSMRARRWGRIVMMSASIVERGMTGSAAYTSSKAALTGLSRNLATELFAAGILCNVVAPGPVVTDRFLCVYLPDEIRAGLIGKSREQIKNSLNDQPHGLRVSTPADVANAVVFLGSAANGNITGRVVHVNGP